MGDALLERLRARGVDVGDEDSGGALEGELGGDGAAGAAGAHDENDLARGVEAGLGLEASDEAAAVGVEAATGAVLVDLDGVDGADEGGGLGDVVEELDDGLLVRNGDVEAAEAEGDGAGHGVAEALGPDLEREVDPREAKGFEAGVVHGRRSGVLNGEAEEAGELGVAANAHGSLFQATCRRHCNMRGLVGKANTRGISRGVGRCGRGSARAGRR